MKLGLAPRWIFPFVFLAATARASPSQEEALADGEIDREDIASQRPFSPLSSLGSVGGRRTVVGAPRDSTWITLGGFTQQTFDARREVGAFVVLGVPFDRFARGSRATTFVGPTELPGLVPGLVPRLVPVNATSPAAPANDAGFDLALAPRLARSCVDAAWRAAGFGADEAALDAIVSRAHWSAALPEARIRAVRFDDATLSLDTGTDTSRLRDSAGANIGLEARLTWRLDRLLYADDEPSFERIRLEHRDARGRIAGKVLEALFHWARAMLDLRTLPPSQLGTRDEADVVLRVMEAEAALDVLTDGWFAVHKTSRSTARRDPPRGKGSTGEL
jgi:hypothetical protein